MGHHPLATSGDDWSALSTLVTSVVDTRRQIAALQAQEAGLLADAVELVTDRIALRRASGRRISDAELPLREASAELGAAMRVSDRAVQGRMGDASRLRSQFAATMAAWTDGRIDSGHASAILDAGSWIVDDALRARFESQVLEIAASETPTRLRGIAQAVAAQIDPDGARERVRRSQLDRHVRVSELGDGMSRLLTDMPSTLAHAIYDRLTQGARTLKNAPSVDAADSASAAAAAGEVGEPVVVTTGTPCSSEAVGPNVVGEPRTIDQLRADILADLLLSGTATAHGDALAAVTARVQVSVPALALAGVTNEPAILNGREPIDIDTARRLAAGVPGWDRVLTHPYTGAVLAVDRYRPGSDLVRFLAARDEHCRFPGCRAPAHRCDVDHTEDAALGGATADGNLAHLCRRHHTLKHETAWTVRQRGAGVLEWRSPIGHIYEDRPPATVRFVPSEWLDRATVGGASTSRDGDPPPF